MPPWWSASSPPSIASFDRAPEELVVDFDATDDSVHGDQVGRFFPGCYDHYCFPPLHVFCGDPLLVSDLRPADVDGAKHAWAILKPLVERPRREWPEVGIVPRAASGFRRHKMATWCARHGVGYIVGLAKNARLNGAAGIWMALAEAAYGHSGETQRWFAALRHGAESWDERRRAVARLEHGAKGANPRYVVTNLEGDGQTLYEDLYCQRGEMENRFEARRNRGAGGAA